MTPDEGATPDDDVPPHEDVPPDEDAREPASRRRNADRLGELLPEQTRDDTANGWGDEDEDDADGRLRREVPPHHGA